MECRNSSDCSLIAVSRDVSPAGCRNVLGAAAGVPDEVPVGVVLGEELKQMAVAVGGGRDVRPDLTQARGDSGGLARCGRRGGRSSSPLLHRGMSGPRCVPDVGRSGLWRATVSSAGVVAGLTGVAAVVPAEASRAW